MPSSYQWTLYYAGTEFDLGVSDENPLDDYDADAPGTIQFSHGGGWLTIAVGPGIPVAALGTPVSVPPRTNE